MLGSLVNLSTPRHGRGEESMPVYRDARNGRWRYRTRVLVDGVLRDLSGSAPAKSNTKQAAENLERIAVMKAQGLMPSAPQPARKEAQKKETPRFVDFADRFLDLARMKNKPSEVATKESTLRVHLKPYFGEKRLDEIGFADIQDYVAAKLAPKTDGKVLSKKSINNHLTVLRRLLVVAKKRGLIGTVPEIEWLKVPKPDFDFLSFEEADRILDADVDSEWHTMILVALRTGMRLGELLALRWEDVDLTIGQVRVCRSVSRGIITTPKSGKDRVIPLGDEVLAALKVHRHLRGELVFCTMAGRMLKKGECKHPLWRACRRAGLRRIGWHVCRHTFASHLVMRGAQLKAVQELLGHATIEMTMRYAHLSPHVSRDAVQLLDRGRTANRVPTDAKSSLTI
ncbi:MAG: site-specific integrase [Pseudomonadota bacterium]